MAEWFGYVRWWFLSTFHVLPPNILSEIADFQSFLAPNTDIFKRNDIQSILNRHQKCEPSIQQIALLVPTSDKYPVDGVYVECISTRCWPKFFCWLHLVWKIILRTFASEINNHTARLSLVLTFVWYRNAFYLNYRFSLFFFIFFLKLTLERLAGAFLTYN